MANMTVPADAKRARDRWRHTKVWYLEPRTVKWLVDSCGIRRTELARRVGAGQGALEEWVRTGRMTYHTMERLARILHRPVLAFFYREPWEDAVLADYRGGVATREGIGTAPALVPRDIVTVRHAQYLQDRAGEMLAVLGCDGEEQGGGGSGKEKKRAVRRRAVSIGDMPPEDAAADTMVRMGLVQDGRRT